MSLRVEALSVEQNSDVTIIRTFIQANGIPIDFTGCTAKMRVRQTQDPASATIFSISTGSGEIALGGAAGTVSITISAALDVAITMGTYYYDLLQIDSLGKQSYLMSGPFVVEGTVSR